MFYIESRRIKKNELKNFQSECDKFIGYYIDNYGKSRVSQKVHRIIHLPQSLMWNGSLVNT